MYEARKTKTSKVLNINTAATMTAIMQTVIKSGTGRAANIGKPAAGKTGTTDDCKDAYFIGFTPDVVTGVWVGNDDNSRMGELTGGTVPAKIWKDVMLVATEPYGNSEFEYPEIILKPFKASSVSVIPQEEARKAFEEQEEKERLEREMKNNPDYQLQIKPDTIKPTEVIQQTFFPIKKKENTVNHLPVETKVQQNIDPLEAKTIEVKSEREEEQAEQFAPVPFDTTPLD